MKQGIRIFIRFFVSYLVVMSIPVGMLIHSYNREIQITRDDMYKRDMIVLEQGQRTMNTIITSMNDMIQTLSGSSAVKKLMIYGNIYDDPSLLTNFIDIRDSLASFNLFSYVDAFLLYAFKGDILINGSQIIYNASSGNIRFILSNPSVKDVKIASELLIGSRYKCEFLPAMTLVQPGQNRSNQNTYIPYIATISTTGDSNAVNVILLLRQDALLRRLGFVGQTDWIYSDIQYKGTSLLSGDRPYSHSHDSNERSGYIQDEINGQPALISYINDERTGLRFTCARSTTLIESMIMSKVQSTIISMILICIFGSILSGIMAFHNTAPIRRTLKNINSRISSSDLPFIEYVDLDKELMSVINENLTLKQEFSVQAPLLRSAIAARWLYGEYKNVDEILDAYAHLDSELNFRIYAVAVAVLPIRRENGKDDLDRVLVKALLRESMPELIDIVDTESDAFALIAGIASRDKLAMQEMINQHINTINSLMFNQLSLELNWFVGIASDAGRVHSIFNELRRLRKVEQSHSDCIIWLNTEQSDSEGLYFPVELEMRIIDSIKNGDVSDLSAAFSLLYTENAIRRALSKNDISKLLAMLQALFMRLNSDFEIAYGSDDISSDILLNQAQKHLLALCNHNCDEHISRQHELSIEIEQFICKNYFNSQLSLASVADHFGYTQSYLSRVFKQQTGQVFSSYVEKLRMRHAMELLTENKLPIYQIAEKCGYNSVQVFRRAFARAYGTSPSTYIDQMKDNS